MMREGTNDAISDKLDPGRTRPSRSGLALAAVTAAVVIVTLDTTILNVAIPTIQRELHTSLGSLQW